MNTSISFLAHTDTNYCIACGKEFVAPFDFCASCWKLYKDEQDNDWVRVLRNNAQKRRRQSRKDEAVGLISLDSLWHSLISERKL